jgi:hypothetical protein
MSGRYVISKHNDGWAIAVDGSMVLICEDREMAIRAVRDAMRDGPPGHASSPFCEAELLEEQDKGPEPLIALAG